MRIKGARRALTSLRWESYKALWRENQSRFVELEIKAILPTAHLEPIILDLNLNVPLL